MSFYATLKNIWALKSILITAIAFCVPLPIIILNLDGEGSDSALWKESRCAYIIIVMATMWLTEAIPISATALFPIWLAPMLGVATAKQMSANLWTDTSSLFFGGLLLAVAIENVGLHKRIALGTMRLVGAQPILLMVGLMVPTWFLSMWISNTAATSMMLPIIQAVIKTLEEVQKKSHDFEGLDNIGYEMENAHPEKNISVDSQVDGVNSHSRAPHSYNVSEEISTHHREQKRIAKGFALCVAYAANIGGIATLTGTPPNLVLRETADINYQARVETLGGDQQSIESGINFANWMGFAFPLSLVTLVVGWAWLQLLFIRCGCCRRMAPEAKSGIKRAVLEEYRALGPVKMSEIIVSVDFCLVVILWLSRAPPNSDGWEVAFIIEKVKYVSDSTPIILLVLILFILPDSKPQVFAWADNYSMPRYSPILTWKSAQEKVPWGVLILLGGGFALAKASQISGLSDYVGKELEVLSKFDSTLMVFFISCIVALATEVTSNTATSQLLLPIMFSLSITIESHPLYLMIATAVACSFAFMLPVATPPNAIVFSTGYLTIPDMALAGLPMNAIAIGCLTLAINTWGKSMYDLDTFPEILRNATATA